MCVCGRICRNLVFLGLLIEFSRMATFRVGYTEYHLFVIIIKCIIAELVTPSSGLSSSVPTEIERESSFIVVQRTLHLTEDLEVALN